MHIRPSLTRRSHVTRLARAAATGCLALAGAASASGGSPVAADAIVGDWLVDSRDAVVRIERAGGDYQGRLVWLKQSTYGPEDGPGLNGKPVTDSSNPDESLRSRPLLGLRMLWGLHYVAGEHAWENGRVYNTDDGQTYHCHVWMEGPNRLKLRGYIGFSLFGGTTTWTRTTAPPPAAVEPPVP